jgi:hypothetical protein
MPVQGKNQTKGHTEGQTVGQTVGRVHFAQEAKLDPQPQVEVAFGFSNVKPRALRPS